MKHPFILFFFLSINPPYKSQVFHLKSIYFYLVCFSQGPAFTSCIIMWRLAIPRLLTFTPPESVPSGQLWCMYALIGEVRVNNNFTFVAIFNSGASILGG